MDAEAVRDAAFCQRHREVTRERGKEIARERLERARRGGSAMGHAVRGRHAVRVAQARDAREQRTGAPRLLAGRAGRRAGATYELEVVQLDPRDGAWLVDKPPLVPGQRFTRHDEWEARIAQARDQFGKE